MSNKENLPQEMFTVQVTRGQKEFLTEYFPSHAKTIAADLRNLQNKEQIQLLYLWNIVETLESF